MRRGRDNGEKPCGELAMNHEGKREKQSSEWDESRVERNRRGGEVAVKREGVVEEEEEEEEELQLGDGSCFG